MNTASRITAFAAAIGATFGAAYAVGGAAGPAGAQQVASEEARKEHGTGHESGAADTADTAEPPGGLQVSQGGYSLDLRTPRLTAGEKGELRFTIEDGKGRKVTAYDREHGKELHLIVASRELDTYRHLHPERAADGTWSTPVDLPEAGGYRVFADFTPRGAEGRTLGADLAVSGAYEPAALPESGTKDRLPGGYEVSLEGRLAPGRASGLKLRVTKDGKPVTDLQPYLGAYGHLVALRAGDLAYLHVHPGASGPGPVVPFTAEVPSPGAYRLFLDFKHDGKVRTADFTVRTAGAGAPAGDGDDHGRQGGRDGEEHGAGNGGDSGTGHGHSQ